ncbi:hypothetical protein B0H17DRAFT_1198283 [Mycena rosella]|uniref:Uncharacterized protein n=1 Tax=Mycena rosella TaxID=1033263 RepID=A0AAD7DP80_MYCRO|nr:hypothetical protein B0H17DRAFT_1198283 [Mycena rosella]
MTTAGKVRVVGLFAPTETEADNVRMAINLADDSWWFTAFPPKNGDRTAIDPPAERPQFLDIITAGGKIEEVDDVHRLKTRFLLAIREASVDARLEDTLIIAICGCADEETGDIIVADGGQDFVPLKKEEIEMAVAAAVIPPERVHLISTACISGLWRSESWTLLAAVSCNDTAEVFAKRTEASDYPALEPHEKEELFRLATEYHRRDHGSSAIDVSVNAKSRKVATHCPIPFKDERILLTRLQYRELACRRASEIAQFLGWKAHRPVEEWTRINGLTEMLEAEEEGAAIATVFFLGAAVGARVGLGRPWKTMGPGAWLADAWITAGRPTVEKNRWETAVAHARQHTKEKQEPLPELPIATSDPDVSLTVFYFCIF